MAKQEIFVHPDCPDCADVIADYNDNPNNFEDAECTTSPSWAA